MFQQKLRKIGDSYVITIPAEEVKRQNLQDGQLVSIEIYTAEKLAGILSDLHEAFNESWQQNEETYRYLAEN